MASATGSVRVAAACLMMLLLLATTATATAAGRRELLVQEGDPPPLGLSKEEPPTGDTSFQVVQGLVEKATGKTARLDLEKPTDEKKDPLMSIP